MMTHSYGRHTYEVENRIRQESLELTARKASKTLAIQHIQISASSCIRVLRSMGRINPQVRTSGYVGLDDFAKWKGHKYMCVIVDHYTRQPLAVFDSRYGQEITDWLASHPEIKVVTRDGSRSYAAIISAASGQIMQISDRFHLMQNLKKSIRRADKESAGTGQGENAISISYGRGSIQVYCRCHLSDG
jgi:transposase